MVARSSGRGLRTLARHNASRMRGRYRHGRVSVSTRPSDGQIALRMMDQGELIAIE
jgi:hypothetical protein